MRNLVIVLLGLWPTMVLASEGAGQALPRSLPETQGIRSAGLSRFLDRVDRELGGLHSLMIVRHGHVVAEGWWAPYDAQTRHELYSLSKSFTSTAVGIAISEGKLRLDDPVLKFFPEDAPAEPSANLKAMRVSDLLRMSTGHQAEPPVRTGSGPWTRTFLAQPVPLKPGTHFLYNTPATYMLSAIVQKATGQTVLDYLQPRLFEPLGIADPNWGTSPEGVSLGGYGLSVRTEDIARFGQLYLQKGRWGNRQLVPEVWVAAATDRQTSNGSNPSSDWDQGYGYQFWRCRNGAYRGDGAFGQFCIVLPELDTVIAITSGVKDMQAVLDLVWAEILPVLGPAPLPEDATASAALRDRLAGLSVPTPSAASDTSPTARFLGRNYRFPANDRKLESVRIESSEARGGYRLIVRLDGAEQVITCRPAAWTRNRQTFGMFPEQTIASSGAWTAPDTFTARVCLVETPFVVTQTLRFEGDSVVLESEANVGFGTTRSPALTGTAGQPLHP